MTDLFFISALGTFSTMFRKSAQVLRGSFPRRALAMVLEWAFAHRDELMENWNLAEAHRPLKQIKPLE
jgi:hypothetical protein